MKECRENNETWPFFWLRVDEATPFRGHAGLQPLLDALNARDETRIDSQDPA
jgi:hypothetical protein